VDGPFGKAAKEHFKEAEGLTKQHTAEPYGPSRHAFSVRGKGGTSLGGERYGGRNYQVDLDKVECTCNVKGSRCPRGGGELGFSKN
jgi:hypothetical protein